MVKKIGSGSYGKVYKAFSKQWAFPCAIKVLPKSRVKDTNLHLQHLMMELEILENISRQSSCLVCVYELLHNHKYFFIVTELFE